LFINNIFSSKKHF